MIAKWKGKPVDELSRDELIEALNWCANEIQRLMKEKEHERNFIFDTFVRGLTKPAPDASPSGSQSDKL